MAAAGFDPATVQKYNPICSHDRRKIVGNDEKTTTDGKGRYSALDRLFVFRIERRRRLIENDDRRVLQDRPGDADPLALTAGKPRTEWTHPGLVTEFETHDRVVNDSGSGGSLHLRIGCHRPADADVVRNGFIKQQGRLEDRGDHCGERPAVDSADILAADQDSSAVRLLKPHEELHADISSAAIGTDEDRHVSLRPFSVIAGACALASAMLPSFETISPRTYTVQNTRESTAWVRALPALVRSRALFPILMVGLGASVFTGLMTFQTSLIRGTTLEAGTYFGAYAITIVGYASSWHQR